jgi:hypothetical protein
MNGTMARAARGLDELRRAAAEAVYTEEVSPDHYADFRQPRRSRRAQDPSASRHYDRASLEALPSAVVWLTLTEAAEETGLSPGWCRALNKLRNDLQAIALVRWGCCQECPPNKQNQGFT